MRGPCIPQLLGFKHYLNNCFGDCSTSMLFPNMRGTRIPRLLGFKHYLNNCSGDCSTSMLFPNMRGPCITQLLGFKNYLNNGFVIDALLCYALICVDHASPGYLGSKIIYIIL